MDRRVQIRSRTPKAVRYEPAPLWTTLTLHCPSSNATRVQHCKEAVAAASVHVDRHPEPTVKAPAGKSNLPSELSSLCLTRLSGWEGGEEDIGQ